MVGMGIEPEETNEEQLIMRNAIEVGLSGSYCKSCVIFIKSGGTNRIPTVGSPENLDGEPETSVERRLALFSRGNATVQGRALNKEVRKAGLCSGMVRPTIY